MTKSQVQITVATVAAAAAFLGPTSAAVVALLRKDPPPTPTPCGLLVKQTLDLARKYPEAVKLYGQSRADRLPVLADKEEIIRCGDPRELLRVLAARAKAGS